MDECDISVLSGDALRRAFLRRVHPGAIGVDSGPLVVAEDDGSTKVFFDGPSLPRVDMVSPAEQAVAAMKLFQSRGARFEATDSNLAVFCTIDRTMALGKDYFEAGMRAYLLSRVNRDTDKQ